MKIKQKTIQNADHLALYDLITFVEECVKEGYTVPNINESNTFPRRFGMGQYSVSMVMEGEGETEYVKNDVKEKSEKATLNEVKVEKLSKQGLLEFLETETSKDGLLQFAKDQGIGVPDNKQRNPNQIKYFLKTAIEQMEE